MSGVHLKPVQQFLFIKNLHIMSYSNATVLLLIAYAGVMLYFAIRGARRTRTLADYALGSQGFSPLVVGLSLAAGITSAATFIINPGFVALYGWSAFFGHVADHSNCTLWFAGCADQKFPTVRDLCEGADTVAVDVAEIQ